MEAQAIEVLNLPTLLTQIPLEVEVVWTSKGTLLRSELRREVQWHNDENCTMCRETYYLGDEIVKQSCEVMLKTGLALLGGQAQL